MWLQLSKEELQQRIEKAITGFDTALGGNLQYQKGLELGKKALYISISINNVWGAQMKDGGHLSSFEKIGYHANTSALLKGFVESGVEIHWYTSS